MRKVPKLRTLLDQSIEATKLTVRLWNSRHKCVKMSKLKMSQTNIRNEPVLLKNIRLGTQALGVVPFLKRTANSFFSIHCCI